MSAVEARGKPGRVAGATREEVVERARARFLECRRVDMSAIAAECGVGRATLYRWFGSREQLLGEAMLGVVEPRIADARAHVGGHGGAALVDTFDLVYRGLAAAPHVSALIEREREIALAVITSSTGPVHPRMVEVIQALIEAEVERGDYWPPTTPPALAYVLVRLAEGLLFNHADDLPKDLDRLREILAALIGA